MLDEPEIYEVKLTPIPGRYSAPPVRRLARWLKCMLRGYGLKCISARRINTRGSMEAK